ncbi:sulfite oxidase-like oxidoreductase [Aeromicrobium sp. CnD17-E]|jgi:DMSO/TMAO reductase YedYZ molybdopterin-dependent catalytic subunit|uniref:sulfite oxidase-like oxidoreductase n=1 Tax=Aeromicrobium sp. CnD17-E TaxID=2954487 RepID=UPI002096EB04|nr:sulfite oxidase-like oxidoreductase [Aeromicrobium sp. CnD17-E]MCO7240590.1 sulfite oxidase-like oxidoreductase [Aeromicrobium sp. CnD17-E]
MSDAPVTRGFVGRRRPAQSDRLPPGQYDAGRQWPVLSAEPTPQVDLDRWTLTVDGAVLEPQTWDWSALRALPHATSTVDIHCVTTWSRFDTAFTGVSVETLLDVCGVASDATHVVAHTASGYTTNLPLDDVRGDRAWVVWEADGAPLTADHGGPVRLLVPHLYFWKSAKWLTRLELLDHDEPGFWERGGYHDRGDPWLEQRYQGDP